MKALQWTAIGLMTLGSALTVFGFVVRLRDRDELRTKFQQYLPGN